MHPGRAAKVFVGRISSKGECQDNDEDHNLQPICQKKVRKGARMTSQKSTQVSQDKEGKANQSLTAEPGLTVWT